MKDGDGDERKKDKRRKQETTASKLNARARRIHSKNERVWTMKQEEHPGRDFDSSRPFL